MSRFFGAVGVCSVITGIVSFALSAGTAGPDRAATVWPPSAARAQDVIGAIQYDVLPQRSEARYRVREQLANLTLPNDAVRRTNAIEGRIVLADHGRVVAAQSRFTVDVRTIQSDEPRRDGYIRRNTLETDRYPTAVFVPTELRGLPFPPPAASQASFELIGNLTVRDVTRSLTWRASATFRERDVSVTASTAFHFGDFGLQRPRVATVLSVEDNIRLEIDLLLRRSA